MDEEFRLESPDATHKPDIGPPDRPIKQALFDAHRLAVAPLMFQAARALLALGLLQALMDAGERGLSIAEAASATGVSEYGVGVLLDAGISLELVRLTGDSYRITKTGVIWLTDESVRVNRDFVHDVCYRAFFHLEESVRKGRPEGLAVFGDWNTVYAGLHALPEPARRSWFRFDHHYSDAAFPQALDIVLRQPPETLLDMGGNTGRFALACLERAPGMRITIADLPHLIDEARARLGPAGPNGRVRFVPVDVLDTRYPLPEGHDAVWMSQFLDCFSERQIVALLERVRAVMSPESALYALEPCWDRQRFDAAMYSLNATSLYFTCVANGNSRMYHSADFLRMFRQAGLAVVEQHDQLGICQTLFVCRRA